MPHHLPEEYQMYFAEQRAPKSETDIIPFNDKEPIVVRVNAVATEEKFDDRVPHLCLWVTVLTPVNENKNIRIDVNIGSNQRFNPRPRLASIAYGDDEILKYALEEHGREDWTKLEGYMLTTTPSLKKGKDGTKPWDYYWNKWQPYAGEEYAGQQVAAAAGAGAEASADIPF